MALVYDLTIKDNGTAVLTKIGGETEKLKKKLSEAERAAGIFSKSLSKMETAFAGFVSIGMAKGVSMLKNFGKEMLQSYDSASKLSDNIGVAAESIVGLRYAADLSSVGSENMDKNMAKLAQTISKAGNGSKEASATFAKMGIAVKNSDGTLKNSEQVLMEMADAFKNLPAGTERATLAMDVFGKSGASMVTMLKDGSGALRDMVSEGAGAAGNIEGISEAMGKFNDAGVKAKTAITGLMASLADSSAFKVFISGAEGASEALSKFNKERAKSKEKEKTEDLKKYTEAVRDYQIKLKDVEKQEAKAAAAGPDNRSFLEKLVGDGSEADKLKKMQKELEELNNKKFKMSFDFTANVDRISEAKAELEGLEQARMRLGYSKNSDEQFKINSLKDYIKELENTAEAEKNAKNAAAAAVAGYGEKEAAMEKANKAAAKAAEDARRLAEQQAKDELKAFEDLVSKREDALKKLEEFEDEMRIASLSGEEKKIEQVLANYKKQEEDLKSMHELEMLLAADKEETLAKQSMRIASLELQRGLELSAISQEQADKRLKNSEAIARFEEDMRNRNLSGWALEQEQLSSGYEKRMEELRKLHEEELANAADREAVLKAQHDRMLALEQAFADERRAINRAAVVQSASDSLEAIGQMTEGYKSYAGLYKASQIGQAMINAHQSVLRTMSSVPFPLNVPLAALQAAAAAVQVRKITAAKMYAGGMIPGGSRYLRVNEEGPEAILNTGAVRAVGGPAGVNALNRGDSIYNTNNSRTSNVNFVINAPFVSQKAYRDEFEPMLKKAARRR